MSEVWIAAWESEDFRFLMGLLAGIAFSELSRLAQKWCEWMTALIREMDRKEDG